MIDDVLAGSVPAPELGPHVVGVAGGMGATGVHGGTDLTILNA